jgi:hypothetical protein
MYVLKQWQIKIIYLFSYKKGGVCFVDGMRGKFLPVLTFLIGD